MAQKMMSRIKSCELTARLTVAAIVGSVLILAGCTADPRDVMQGVKEIEPELEQRNHVLRELSGVKDEKSK